MTKKKTTKTTHELASKFPWKYCREETLKHSIAKEHPDCVAEMKGVFEKESQPRKGPKYPANRNPAGVYSYPKPVIDMDALAEKKQEKRPQVLLIL